MGQSGQVQAIHSQAIQLRGDRRRAILEGTLVALVLLLVGLLASFGLWRSAADSLRTQLREEMARLAQIAAAGVDAELHATITDPGQMQGEAYARAVEPLRRFRDRAPGVKYVYTAVRREPAGGEGPVEVRFVLDAATPGDHDGDGVEDQAAVNEIYDDCEEEIHVAFGDGRDGVPTASPEPYSDQWGTFITGYAPFRDASGAIVGVVGVDMVADRYIARLAAAQSRAVWGLVPAGVVSVALGTAAFAMRRHTLRLKRAEASASDALRVTVDELAERNRELEHLRNRAEDAAEAKASFLANMSHEIRTPLTAVLGYLDLLEENIAEEASLQRSLRLGHLRTIRSAGEHLLVLINDILDFSKIEAGRMSIESVTTDLSSILEDTETIFRSSAADRGVGLEIRLESAIPAEVQSDPTRVRQILFNLVGNAVKFTERGSILVLVRFRDGAVELDVEDTGPGMTREQADRLFRPFTQADASVTRRHGGTGLGLSICRRLGELLGGSVELLRTAPNEGATFRFRLPARYPSVRLITTLRRGASAPCMGTDRVDAPTLKGRILLAEDGKDNQRLISHHLRKAGAEVEIAENGVEALAILDRAAERGAPFDLLLTDVQMPEMDGCTLARTIRDRGNAMPIVALTAHAMAEDRDRCTAAGCDDYATKPIDRAKLVATCARWIARRTKAA